MMAVVAAIPAFLLVLVFMPPLIRILKERQHGQTIYELGPQAHLSKKGTPNMGGLLIASACVVVSLVFAFIKGVAWQMLPMLLAALAAMAVGFVDDYHKNIKKEHEGLRPKQKLMGQVLAGLLFSMYCYTRIGSDIHLPFSSRTWDLGILYIPLMTLLYMFMTNSANLQDGADGLLSSVTVVGAIAFGVIALAISPLFAVVDGMAPAILSFALAGACAGFFVFNRYPAKIFMGDTGSMFIGSAVTAVAMVLGLQFWLLPIAFTMIMSSVSVIIQRLYYKATHGKRIFKMSPIHHHFELSGMKENQIVVMYALVTLVLSVLAALMAIPLMG